MHDFKKGDLVEHVPTGCVGRFEWLDNDYLCVSVGGQRRTCWETKDCRPATNYKKVFDAAKALLNNIEWEEVRFDSPRSSGMGRATVQTRRIYWINLADAIEKVQPEYKWIGMDIIGHDGHGQKYTTRPCWSRAGLYGGSVTCDTITPPSFLKPGQLWERCKGASCSDGFCLGNEYTWNGYWWKKVEDHNRSCENCKNHSWTLPNSAGQQTELCYSARVLDPSFGMEGCKWEGKK